MSEETKQPEKKKRIFKPRFEVIQPVRDIVDSWRLLDQSFKEDDAGHPYYSDDDPDLVRAHLYNFMVSQGFFGIMAKIGRKPIGQIIGQVHYRPIGRPKQFFFVWNFYVAPQYRRQGVMLALFEAFRKELKQRGIMCWEANAGDKLTEVLLNFPKYKTEKLENRIGGRF